MFAVDCPKKYSCNYAKPQTKDVTASTDQSSLDQPLMHPDAIKWAGVLLLRVKELECSTYDCCRRV